MSAKKKSANDWLREILEAENLKSSPDEIPEGWFTLDEIAKRASMSKDAMKSVTERWMRSGIATRKQFRIRCESGQMRKVWHYNKA